MLNNEVQGEQVRRIEIQRVDSERVGTRGENSSGISKDKIAEAVKKVKSGKASGVDEIYV